MIDETSDTIIDETNPSGNNSNNNGPKMKFCPHCGKLKPENARFCPECGRDRSGSSASDIGRGRQMPYSPAPTPAYAGQAPAAAGKTTINQGFGEGITALIISLINFFIFGSFLSFIAVPVTLIFAGISLKKGKAGRVVAIISIIVSIISALLFALYVAIIVKVAPDIKYFADNDKEIIAEYYETGEIPERYEKYRDSKYNIIWKEAGFDDFDDFFGFIVREYRDSVYDADDDWYEKNSRKGSKSKSKTSEDKPDKVQTTTKKNSSIRDGEDLVVLS